MKKSTRSKRPVMALIEIMGRRWTLRVLWELRTTPHAFRSLQEACGGISPTVLNQRLTELRDAALVELGDAGYALTPLGAEPVEILLPVARWAETWAARPDGR